VLLTRVPESPSSVDASIESGDPPHRLDSPAPGDDFEDDGDIAHAELRVIQYAQAYGEGKDPTGHSHLLVASEDRESIRRSRG
jgi:hypothetical protein